MSDLHAEGVELEVSKAEMLRELGLSDRELVDRVLKAMTPGNWEYVGEHLVSDGDICNRVFAGATDGNWNFVADKLWQPTVLIGRILQWLRSNPTTGIH